MSRWVKSALGESRTLSQTKSKCFHGNFMLTNENTLMSIHTFLLVSESRLVRVRFMVGVRIRVGDQGQG